MASPSLVAQIAGRYVLAATLIALLAALAMPWLQRAVAIGRLISEPPPTHLPVPVAGVGRDALRDTWGSPRDRDRIHEGIDIFARRGTPVQSTTRGIVWRIGENALGGTVVWVLGPGGDMHYYAHLDRVAAIDRLQSIEAGTVLGYVGNTGNARTTPPHLHYGIYRRGGGAINPYPLIKGQSSEVAA